MKKINISSGLLLSAILLSTSCKKFEDLNVNPKDASVDQVQVEYFINHSIINAQMDPHVAERVFVLYWKTAGRQHYSGGLSSGAANDSWTVDYFRYISEWLNSANTAIKIADEKSASGKPLPAHHGNLKQVARIWRAYLMSEMADNFGPIPVNGFQSVNPDYVDLKTVYYHLLSELKDAGDKLDLAIQPGEEIKNYDAAYSFDFKKWKRYANSMRLRLAMRLSEVDPAKAKAEFEAAVTGDLITTQEQAFSVKESDQGWNALTGVMSRDNNAQILSTTLENIYTGLGGVKAADQLADRYLPYIKPANWAGLKLTDHFSALTNDPYAGFFFDGIPYTLDPRALKTFILGGDIDNPEYPKFPAGNPTSWKTTKRNLVDGNNNVVKEIDGAFAWNGTNGGAWGTKGARNQWRLGITGASTGAAPRLGTQFRNSRNRRIFFAPWEIYFLISEAAIRGWTVPLTGKEAYETGVKLSFEYWGVLPFANAYLASTDFSRTGTSVSFDHVAEPPATYPMNYKDGYTNANGTVNIAYPVNTIYKNGAVRNDQLTKIITQKFIAQTPWLPLESWNDHRRLGLPFLENPNVEESLPGLLELTPATYMTNRITFYPQRLPYPSSLPNTNTKGYKQAVDALGGPDLVLTPLWWAKH